MRAVVFAYSNVGDRCLRVLRAQGVEVPLVVTHRDQPGEKLWFERVADTAAELGLPVIHGDDVHDPALARAVRASEPDVIFSFYFRSLIPVAVLSLAARGAFNMHGSLLPSFRGRAPTNWAVLKGATETGATLHVMTERADAGAIVDQQAVPVLPDDTGRQVFDKVTVAAEQVLWRSLPAIVAGQLRFLPNDVERGSYFGARRPEDGRIDWSKPAAEVYNLIRAVAPPYPGAFIEVAGRRLIVAKARLARASRPGDADLRPGLHVVGDAVIGVCGDGAAIAVLELFDGVAAVSAATLRALLQASNTPLP